MKVREAYYCVLIVIFLCLLVTGYAREYAVLIFVISLILLTVPGTVSAFTRRSAKEFIPSIARETLLVPTSKLLISSFWESNKTDKIVAVSNKLGTLIETGISLEGGGTVKNIKFQNKESQADSPSETLLFDVGGGYLLFGDSVFLDKIRREGAVEKGVLGIYDADTDPPYALFRDQEGIKAIAVLTGEGDGRYAVDVKSELSGAFTISAIFLDEVT